jgi:hypothetical protein
MLLAENALKRVKNTMLLAEKAHERVRKTITMKYIKQS